MPDLTDSERRILKDRPEMFRMTVRPVEQWMTILRDLSLDEAAARFFGDLRCYTADRRKGISFERRDDFLIDVRNLANAFKAFVELAHAQHDNDEAA